MSAPSPASPSLGFSFSSRPLQRLEALSERIQAAAPDVVLAITRKAQRLIDLITQLGIALPGCEYHTDVSFHFVRASDWTGKRVLVFEDITIVGSQLSTFREELRDAFPGTTFIFHSLCIDDRWYLYDLAPLDLPAEVLSSSEAAVFCTEEVRAFRLLNKPYAIDFPIVQTRLTGTTAWRAANEIAWFTTANVGTMFQTEQGLEAVSILLPPFAWQPVQRAILRSDLIPPEIADPTPFAKLRLFRNTRSGEMNVAPMTRLVLPHSVLAEGVFERSLAPLNELVHLIAASSEYHFRDRARCLAINFLLSYLLGAVCLLRWAQHEPGLSLPFPASGLQESDIAVLFGPRLAAQVGAACEEILSAQLERFSGPNTCPELSSAATALPALRLTASTMPGDTQELFKAIKPKLDDEFRFRRGIREAVGVIFRVMHQTFEIPERRMLHEAACKVRRRGDAKRPVPGQIRDAVSRLRLKRGFTWEELLWILDHYRIIDPGSIDDRTEVAFAIDFGIDAGAMVPRTLTSGPTPQRVYRYGENSDDDLRDRFLAEALQALFTFAAKATGRDLRDVFVPKIAMEKTLVLLHRFMISNGPTLNVLHRAERQLREAQWLHGTVIITSTEDPGPHGHEGPWLTHYLKDRKILGDSAAGGYIYDREYLDERERSESMIGVPAALVAEASRLAQLAWSIDRLARDAGNSKHDWLICLTSCNNARTLLSCLRMGLHLWFEAPHYTFDKAIRRLLDTFQIEALLSLDSDKMSSRVIINKVQAVFKREDLRSLVGAPNGRAALLTAPKEAVDQLTLKLALFDNRIEIRKQIQDRLLRERAGELDFPDRHTLQRYVIDHIEAEPLTAPQRKERDMLAAMGDACQYFSSTSLSIGRLFLKISEARRTKAGEVHATDFGSIQRLTAAAIDALDHLAASWKGLLDSGFELRTPWTPPSLSQVRCGGELPHLVLSAHAVLQYIQKTAAGELCRLYQERYAGTKWKMLLSLLFPGQTGIITRHKWILWMDIKDSSGKRCMENRLKTVEMKRWLGEGLAVFQAEHAGTLIPRGAYDKDDERFILFDKDEHVLPCIRRIIARMNDGGMFVRVGVASYIDTGNQFSLDEDTQLPVSEPNHVLSKRIATVTPHDSATALPADERYDAHTLVVSNEAKRRLFGAVSMVRLDDVSLQGVERSHVLHWRAIISPEEIP